MLDSGTISMFAIGLLESLYMTLVSTFIAYIIGLPLGVLVVVTERGNILPIKWINKVLNVFINLTRSVPFLILMVAIIPLTRLIVGTPIGSTAAIVSLVVAASPFIARMVESSIKEIDKGVIEAALSMGASPFQIIRKVMLPEAKPSLIAGCTIAITTILGYSAMAGAVGGGGLGAIAINYGYLRYDDFIMFATVVMLIVLVQIFQEIGTKISEKQDKRK